MRAYANAAGRVAVVTGANQGLGLALVAGLRRRLVSPDVVYLTGRDPGRVARQRRRWRTAGWASRPELSTYGTTSASNASPLSCATSTAGSTS